jgi:hypothetical protein
VVDLAELVSVIEVAGVEELGPLEQPIGGVVVALETAGLGEEVVVVGGEPLCAGSAHLLFR